MLKNSQQSIVSLKHNLARTIQCNTLPEGTYLAGGTSVYFYLHHGLSVDLDFFTPNRFISAMLLHAMRECFDEVGVELLGKDTVIFYLGSGKLKFSLFHFPYRLLSEPYETQIQEGVVCPLAYLEDIIAMKSVAINQRGSMKDFSEVAALVVDKYGLTKDYDYQIKTSFGINSIIEGWL